MAHQYRILDENGEEYASAGTVAACAKAQGVTPKFQAEFDVARLNDEAGYRAFREERVTDPKASPKDYLDAAEAALGRRLVEHEMRALARAFAARTPVGDAVRRFSR